MAPQVIVVGGGFAGLAAARALRAGGCAARVIERAPALGGRGVGGDREGAGMVPLLSGRDQVMTELVEHAGLAGEMLPLRPQRLFQVQGNAAVAIDPVRTLGIAQMPGVRWRDALRLRRLPRLLAKFAAILDPGDPLRALRLDDRSVADFLRLYFGSSALEHWAAPFVQAELHTDPSETSRLAFLLHHLARQEAPVGLLRGRVARLAQALAGSEDLLATRVCDVEPRRGGGWRIRVVRGGEEELLEADGIVLATPPRVAAGLLGPLLGHAERQVLTRTRFVPALVMAAVVEGRVARRACRYRFDAAERRPLASLSVEPGGGGAPVPEGCGRVVAVARADWSREHLEAADDVVEKVLLGSLERLLPGSTRALRSTELLRLAEAIPCFGVGRYRELARLARVEVDRLARGRWLTYAGDWRVAPTLEGAAGSGRRAGEQLAAAFAAGS